MGEGSGGGGLLISPCEGQQAAPYIIYSINLSKRVDLFHVGFDSLQSCSCVCAVLASKKPLEALIGGGSTSKCTIYL